MVRATALILTAALAGPAFAAPAVPQIIETPEPVSAGMAVRVVEFKAKDYAWAAASGTNAITGDAMLRTRGGEVRTCAGLSVDLWPVGDFTLNLFSEVFGGPTGGFLEAEGPGRQRLPLSPDLLAVVKHKVCNAQGAFVFSGLPDGAYYVVAKVTWETPNMARYSRGMSTQGGEIAKMVVVKGGQTETLTLTQ